MTLSTYAIEVCIERHEEPDAYRGEAREELDALKAEVHKGLVEAGRWRSMARELANAGHNYLYAEKEQAVNRPHRRRELRKAIKAFDDAITEQEQ